MYAGNGAAGKPAASPQPCLAVRNANKAGLKKVARPA